MYKKVVRSRLLCGIAKWSIAVKAFEIFQRRRHFLHNNKAGRSLHGEAIILSIGEERVITGKQNKASEVVLEMSASTVWYRLLFTITNVCGFERRLPRGHSTTTNSTTWTMWLYNLRT